MYIYIYTDCRFHQLSFMPSRSFCFMFISNARFFLKDFLGLASIVPIPGMSLAPSFSMTGTVTTTVSGLNRMVQITQRVVDHGSSTNTSLTKQCRN